MAEEYISRVSLFSLMRDTLVYAVDVHRQYYVLSSMTHAAETGSRNRRHRPKSDRFDARLRRQFFFVPMHDF